MMPPQIFFHLKDLKASGKPVDRHEAVALRTQLEKLLMENWRVYIMQHTNFKVKHNVFLNACMTS